MIVQQCSAAVVGFVVPCVMSDCLPHFLWQQSIASPPPQSFCRRHEQKKETGPTKLSSSSPQSVVRSVAPPFLSLPSSLQGQQRSERSGWPSSLFFLSLAIGSKCYFGREKVPCAARQAKHSGTSSSLGGRWRSPLCSGPFQCAVRHRPCPCSLYLISKSISWARSSSISSFLTSGRSMNWKSS